MGKKNLAVSLRALTSRVDEPRAFVKKHTRFTSNGTLKGVMDEKSAFFSSISSVKMSKKESFVAILKFSRHKAPSYGTVRATLFSRPTTSHLPFIEMTQERAGNVLVALSAPPFSAKIFLNGNGT